MACSECDCEIFRSLAVEGTTGPGGELRAGVEELRGTC